MTKNFVTNSDDDFLYDWLIDFLRQYKLVNGGTALASTLRRHSNIKRYLLEKQIAKLSYVEETYFVDSGLDPSAIQNYHLKKRSLKNN